MKSRVYRLLTFSSPIKSISHLQEASIFDNPSTTSLLQLLFPCLPKTHFSSIPNRPMRGEKRDEQSEDLFLRNLNFGDDNDEKKKEIHHSSPPHTPSRPVGGERTVNARVDLFPVDEDEKMSRARQSPPTPMPNRAMRGERREDGPLRQTFKDSSEKLKSFRQNPPTQFADRPPKGEERDDLSVKNFNLSDQSERPFSEEKIGCQSESSILQNLKFENADGGEKEEKTHPNASTQMDSALPESSLQDADEIFKKMKETGLIPNAVAMLDGLCKDGLIQEAMKLFGLMREKGTIPEVVIYTAVVEGFCKAAKFDDAIRIFRKMQKNAIVPNAFSYTVLIQGLCKGKKLEDAVEFFLEMLDAAHSPNVVTFTGLVDGFCREKGVEEAGSVIRRLRERGFAVDEKAVRDHLDKKGPFSPLVWEAIFGKREDIFGKQRSQRPF